MDPPRRRANQRRGHGTYATDRPPIFSVVGRESRAVRFEVQQHADAAGCRAVLAGAVKPGARILNTDEWRSYEPVTRQLHLRHATVKHGRAGSRAREWARDDDGDGVREVHVNSCEGAGTGVRNYLREFRGVHKQYLADYIATYEAMSNERCFNSRLLRRMCVIQRPTQSKET